MRRRTAALVEIKCEVAETDRYMELFTMYAFSFGFQYFCNDVFG
jgi:hypothetical protein